MEKLGTTEKAPFCADFGGDDRGFAENVVGFVAGMSSLVQKGNFWDDRRGSDSCFSTETGFPQAVGKSVERWDKPGEKGQKPMCDKKIRPSAADCGKIGESFPQEFPQPVENLSGSCVFSAENSKNPPKMTPL